MSNHVCLFCKKSFRDKRKIAKFCSHDCYGKSMKGQERLDLQKRNSKKCVVCGKIFEVRNCHNHVKTCSIKCGGIVRRGIKWEKAERINKSCINCGDAFRMLKSANKKDFCTRKCYLSFRSKDVKYPDKQRFQGSSWIKIRNIIINRDKCCKICNGKGVEVHHIVPYSISGDDSIENLILLCKSCHLKTHRQMWEEEKLSINK